MRRLVNFSGLLPLSKKIHLGTILYGNFSTISVFVPLTKFTASLCFINFVYHNICRLCCKFVCQLKAPFGGTCQGQTQYANPIMLGWGWGCPPPPQKLPPLQSLLSHACGGVPHCDQPLGDLWLDG